MTFVRWVPVAGIVVLGAMAAGCSKITTERLFTACKDPACASCRGTGSYRCTACGGRGQVQCSNCGGRGHKQNVVTKTTDPCFLCSSTGLTTCTTCGGGGMVKCGKHWVRYRCTGCGEVFDYKAAQCPKCGAK